MKIFITSILTFTISLIFTGSQEIKEHYNIPSHSPPGLISDCSEQDSHLVARWCFENSQLPHMDFAPSGQASDKLNILGSVTIRDGIARFPAGKEGVGLKVKSSVDIKPSAEMTIWARLRVDAQPVDTIWLLDKGTVTRKNRSYGIYITPDDEENYQISPKAKLSNDGISWIELSSEVGNDKPTAGLWIQLAMIIWNEGPMMNSVLCYRTEHTSRPNPWRLLCRSSSLQTVFDSYAPLFIGNNSNLDKLSTELWVDEVKIYDRALSLEELNNTWAVLAAYPEVPKTVPGTVISHSPAKTGIHIGDPSIVVMPDGTYIAEASGGHSTAHVFQSNDRGLSWERIAVLEKMGWTNIFYHNEALYMMGTDGGHLESHCIIRKSEDGGYTWTTPIDKDNGLLFENTPYHTAPMQMIIHNGRIWRTMEDEQGHPSEFWGTRFRAFMMSAPIDADLLKASNWTSSDRLGYNPDWLGGKFRGWLEGNAVVDPQGNIVNVLRADNRPDGGKAAIIHYTKDGKHSFFDPEKDFIDFPGGNKKFFIRFDEKSVYYWALSSVILPKHKGSNLDKARDYVRKRVPTSSNPGGEHAFSNPERTRNTMALMTSSDLHNWEIRKIVLYHPEISKHGFQYPHFVFDKEDIIFVSRTAYDDGQGGAENQHNANFITFHRIKDFRSLISN